MSQDDLFMIGPVVLSERAVAKIGWVGTAVCLVGLVLEMRTTADRAFCYTLVLLGVFLCCTSIAALRRWSYVSMSERRTAFVGLMLLLAGTVMSLVQMVRP